MRHKILLAALLLTTGCQTGWDDVPGARLRPVSSDAGTSTERWSAAVLRAAGRWDDLMTQAGCEAPFSLEPADTGAHPVELVAPADWEYGDDTWGVTWGDEPSQPPGGVHVRSDAESEREWQPTLLHELGHALGLEHSAVPGTIMWPSAGRDSATDVTPEDVRAAVVVLGCGE